MTLPYLLCQTFQLVLFLLWFQGGKDYIFRIRIYIKLFIRKFVLFNNLLHMLALSCAMHRIVEILLYFKPKGGKSQLKSLSPLLPPSQCSPFPCRVHHLLWSNFSVIRLHRVSAEIKDRLIMQNKSCPESRKTQHFILIAILNKNLSKSKQFLLTIIEMLGAMTQKCIWISDSALYWLFWANVLTLKYYTFAGNLLEALIHIFLNPLKILIFVLH